MSKRQNRMNGKPRLVPSDIPESPCASPACAAPMATPPAPVEITTFAPTAVVGQAIPITPEELARVRAIEERKAILKAQVGDVEAQKFTLLLALREAEAQAVALALEIVKARGIDPADLSKGWNFDSGRGLITRTK